MTNVLLSARGRGNVTSALRAFIDAGNDVVFDMALQRLPSDEEREKFRVALSRASRIAEGGGVGYGNEYFIATHYRNAKASVIDFEKLPSALCT